MKTPLLVTTEWLAAHLTDPDVRIVDVRWYLLDKDKTGQSEYARGHIPGALYLDLDTDLSAPRGMGPGRHPLPSPAAFAEVALARRHRRGDACDCLRRPGRRDGGAALVASALLWARRRSRSSTAASSSGSRTRPPTANRTAAGSSACVLCRAAAARSCRRSAPGRRAAQRPQRTRARRARARTLRGQA